MTNGKNRTFLTIVSSILLFAGGMVNAHGQQSELRTLLGKIRWNKAMGVLPKARGTKEAAENICAQFFVVVIVPGSEKPYQYDIALEARPEPSKPDYNSCRFEMKVPTNVPLSVYAGMGDGLAWPKTVKDRFYYSNPWIDAGRYTRGSGRRIFSPEKRDVMLQNKDMQVTFELVYEQ